MEPVNLNRLAYFAAVAETGSFTKAAERLGMTKAVVSQQVSRLEAELKTSLFVRTTRKVEPTEAGRLLHQRCNTIFKEAEDAIEEIGEINAEPMGTLRIAAPNDYGTYAIAPMIADFVGKFPNCRVELHLSDERVDLIADHVDLSIRVGWLDDSGYQARRIGQFRQLLVAETGLAKSLTLEGPEDLLTLPFIANEALKEPTILRLSKDDFNRQTIRMQQSILTNATPAVLAATLAKGGVAALPDYLASASIADGKLTRLLPDWDLPAGGIYVVYPTTRFRPAKVTEFVAMLTRSGKNAFQMIE